MTSGGPTDPSISGGPEAPSGQHENTAPGSTAQSSQSGNESGVTDAASVPAVPASVDREVAQWLAAVEARLATLISMVDTRLARLENVASAQDPSRVVAELDQRLEDLAEDIDRRVTELGTSTASSIDLMAELCTRLADRTEFIEDRLDEVAATAPAARRDAEALDA